MAKQDQIGDYVRHALSQGADPRDIRAGLAAAGWTQGESDRALAAWLVRPDLPPIPRPMPYISAGDALIYGLMVFSLGVLSWHICSLGFDIIDSVFPDKVHDYGPSLSGIRLSMAALIGFTPVFFWLNHLTGPKKMSQSTRQRSILRRWSASLTLLIAAMVLLGDLVATIYALLEGDLSIRFAAKAAVVAVTAGLIFAYYRDDLHE